MAEITKCIHKVKSKSLITFAVAEDAISSTDSKIMRGKTTLPFIIVCYDSFPSFFSSAIDQRVQVGQIQSPIKA